ncbi:unnamed protein product [Bursaphelenchus okinawaensis]|uniref:Uncharacterized protein n=1 Tax=Bursaphelenchus okinawaensis TaxID=465554 RepID=A0A811KS00_9BILA|nr:unnamed protein product [Bursaphelenchus okinawaensis]CAG9112162.1 unnamed protein product [Bursaphelenchus okinawaensis]
MRTVLQAQKANETEPVQGPEATKKRQKSGRRNARVLLPQLASETRKIEESVKGEESTVEVMRLQAAKGLARAEKQKLDNKWAHAAFTNTSTFVADHYRNKFSINGEERKKERKANCTMNHDASDAKRDNANISQKTGADGTNRMNRSRIKKVGPAKHRIVEEASDLDLKPLTPDKIGKMQKEMAQILGTLEDGLISINILDSDSSQDS